MKLSQNLIDIINKQINAEQYSAQFYLAMALDMEDKNLPGIAQWFHKQATEEQAHAQDMIHYLQSRGVRPTLQGIHEVQTGFSSALEAFESGLSHEQSVTAMIHNIVKLTLEEADYGAENFFRKYITEQEEEEANFSAIVEMVRQAGEKHIFIIDERLGARA